MRLSRLFVEMSLTVGQEISLPKESAHYLLNVLRLRVDTPVILFNGQGGEYIAFLTSATKKIAQLQITEHQAIERDSTLQLTLVQAISRPEHINYTIQKAVELGVKRIVPVISERSPPLDQTKINKREQHWRKIIISACEQCGRNCLPQLSETMLLTDWLQKKLSLGLNIVLSPDSNTSWKQIKVTPNEMSKNGVTILIGAEGGLTEMETQLAIKAGYQDIRLGARILRTETAATAILAMCQAWWGDF
jgi:16S rRNA (uracil1498-N3)-methyltransferase